MTFNHPVTICLRDGEWHSNIHIAIDFHISVSDQTIVVAVEILPRISRTPIECKLRFEKCEILLNA